MFLRLTGQELPQVPPGTQLGQDQKIVQLEILGNKLTRD